KVAVMGPEATPPESKAMAVKMGGTTKVRARATRYPGTTKYRMGRPVSTRIMARPLAMATATHRLRPMALAEMAPLVRSSTCLFSTWTAGSALMMNQPISTASGISRRPLPWRTISPPRVAQGGEAHVDAGQKQHQQHHRQDGPDGAQRHQAEAVVLGLFIAADGGHAHAQRHDKGDGHGAGGDAARVEGHRQKPRVGPEGQQEHRRIKRQQQPPQRKAQQDADHTYH